MLVSPILLAFLTSKELMAREKILVVDPDLDSLSKIYLALVHRKFKTEACNNPGELADRLKRFKPVLIVLGPKEYQLIWEKLKIPAIVIREKDCPNTWRVNDGDIELRKPVHADDLIRAIEKLI